MVKHYRSLKSAPEGSIAMPEPVKHSVLLSCRGVSWSPGGRAAGPMLVRDIDLDLRRGEMVGLIGPNGAGKSSLIRLLTGYQHPVAGEVLLEGRPIQDWSFEERARAISYCAQETSQDFPFSLRSLVAMGRYAHVRQKGLIPSGPANLVDSLVDYVGLGHKADQSFQSLSGGEKQLGLFARALAQDGGVFILDEPSSGLDMGTEHRLFSMLRELCMEGRGVIAAVHHLNTAAEYCDRLVLMDHGTIKAAGRPQEILRPDLLEEVYGIKVKVSMSEYTGAPLVQHGTLSQLSGTFRVHIIGGGGSAMNLTRLLVGMGIKVSGGVSHGFDSDCRLWKNLGLEQVEVPPFSTIDDASFQAALLLVRQADLVVLADFPVGPGNYRNLELALAARRLVSLADPARDHELHGEEARTAWNLLIPHLELINIQDLHKICLSGT